MICKPKKIISRTVNVTVCINLPYFSLLNLSEIPPSVNASAIKATLLLYAFRWRSSIRTTEKDNKIKLKVMAILQKGFVGLGEIAAKKPCNTLPWK